MTSNVDIVGWSITRPQNLPRRNKAYIFGWILTATRKQPQNQELELSDYHWVSQNYANNRNSSAAFMMRRLSGAVPRPETGKTPFLEMKTMTTRCKVYMTQEWRLDIFKICLESEKRPMHGSFLKIVWSICLIKDVYKRRTFENLRDVSQNYNRDITFYFLFTSPDLSMISASHHDHLIWTIVHRKQKLLA